MLEGRMAHFKLRKAVVLTEALLGQTNKQTQHEHTRSVPLTDILLSPNTSKGGMLGVPFSRVGIQIVYTHQCGHSDT